MIQGLMATLLTMLCTNGCSLERVDESAAHGSDEICTVVEQHIALPPDARETSGLGLASAAPDGALLWTHNDRGGEPLLLAVSATGALVRTITVTGATLEDWEDIEAGACDGGRCLYIADIGDNDNGRASITIYEVGEPAAGARATETARILTAVYPDGPHNAEALFRLPSGDLYIVTKGDHALYRYAASSQANARVPLERIGAPLPLHRQSDELVTGATASPDGTWVAVRTYATLYFFRASELVGGTATDPIAFDLAFLRESQGEGVAMGADGTVWLSSEAEDEGSPRLTRLTCVLPAE